MILPSEGRWLDTFSLGGMAPRLHGLVLHIEHGTEGGTFSFNSKNSLAGSSHFGNPKFGPLEQFVDTDCMAWAQMSGNHDWISIENEGQPGDSLTPSQIENVAKLFAWLYWNKNVPLRLADTPASFGLGYHSMGGKAWGGKHWYCPGKPVINQRLRIIEIAAHWLPRRDSGAVLV